nr:hypothetical protein [Tanacetum cinerariifolium]
MEPQLGLYVRLGEMLGLEYPTIGIRVRLSSVVVWMVFPRLDPGSTVFVDPDKPCTERKPVKGGVFRWLDKAYLPLCCHGMRYKRLANKSKGICAFALFSHGVYRTNEIVARFFLFLELQERVGSGEWVDMMILYCRRAAAEDREFVRRISMLRGEMINVREKRVDFVQELESVSGVIATVKTAEFLHET